MSNVSISGAPPRPPSIFASATLRSALWQALALTVTAIVLAWFVNNAMVNLSRANIASGFGFLDRAAGFSIIETPIEYSPASTYGRAFVVGILNGAKIAVLSIILATVIGVTVGVLQLSSHPLASRLATGYVEVLRNIPLLLQLFFWYALLLKLPNVRSAFAPLPGVFLANRGLFVPSVSSDGRFIWVAAAIALSLVAIILLFRRSSRTQKLTGRKPAVMLPSLLILAVMVVGSILIFDVPLDVSVPELKGFNFAGGMLISPEFTALLVGLSLYSASYIAENVRSGILSVGRGQWEAAGAIGLTSIQTLRLVVMPQALRIVIPPMISTYGGIIKSTSLGVAIGYPELISISNTIMNQTGQAVETIGIVMAVFLAINILLAAFLNWFNARLAYRER